MKVIGVDNFDRETVSDVLICENVSKFYGDAIVEALNDRYSGHYSDVYFKLVADDHKLYVFEP